MAPSAIKKMFEQDFSKPQDANLAMSQEDLKFLNITSNGIHSATVRLLCNKKDTEARLKQ